MKDKGEVKKSSSKKPEEKPSSLKAEDILDK